MAKLFPLGLSLLALLTLVNGQPLAAFDWPQGQAPSMGSVSVIFEFANSSFIENLATLPDGRVLFTTLDSGLLRVIDTTSCHPYPHVLALLPNSTGLTGIARLPNADHYAITGGMHSSFAFDRGTMKVFVVSVSSGRVIDTIPVADTAMMNGLLSIPPRRDILLSADSLTGRILRVDASTRKVDVAFGDPEFGPPDDADFPLGINGIRYRDGYLYFTNSGRGTFGRVKIDNRGNKASNVEIVARLTDPPSMSNAFDDFDFDLDGNAYLSLHSSTLTRVSPAGVQTTFAGGPSTGGCDDTLLFREPTSLALSNDGDSVFVSTGGNVDWGCDPVLGGQIIEIKLR